MPVWIAQERIAGRVPEDARRCEIVGRERLM